MKLLLHIFQKHFFTMFLAVCVCIISFLLSVSWNLELSRMIQRVHIGEGLLNTEMVNLLLPVMGVIMITGIETISIGNAAERCNHELRIWYMSQFKRFSLDEIRVGEQISMLQNEVSEITGYISENLFKFFKMFINFTGTFVLLFILNEKLALLSNIPVIFILIYVTMTSRGLKQYAVESQEANARMNRISEVVTSLFPIIYLYDAGKMMYKEYFSTIEDWKKAEISEEKKKALLMSVSAMISVTPLILLFFVGGSMVIKGQMEIGVLYIFLNLSGNTTGVSMNLPGSISTFRRFWVNMRRIIHE